MTQFAIDDWMMMMMMMSWVACDWLARSVARCVFQRATGQQQGVQGCGFVGLALFVALWVSGVWRWSMASVARSG